MPASESRFYIAFRETLVEFFQKTSLNGFGLLYYIRRRKYQRLFWFMFILMGISFATYVVGVTLFYFVQDPTVTSLVSQHQPIWNIPFPAIAICSVNKLSDRAVKDYVQQISQHSLHNWSLETWIEKMKLFAAYFDIESVDADEAMDFQDKLGQENFNVSAVLKKLSPSCENLLLKCNWAGSLKLCNEIFVMEATAAGYCCIFNYQHGLSTFPVKYPNGTGFEMGLSVLLNASSSDYFYTERSTHGFAVQLFAVSNFPDTSTGEVQEFFITPGDDVDVELMITTQMTTPEVYGYSAAKRHCYFADEHVQEYGLTYSKAQCLSQCKVRNILALCDCVPYYTPHELIDLNQTLVYCTLAHAECLQRYSVSWNTYRTMEHSMSEVLQKELQDSLTCPNCLPLCTFNSYTCYKKRNSKLSRRQNSYRNNKIFETIDNLDGISLVKFYFPSMYSMQYHKNVIYNWYQILSNIGGVTGICMGCSIISGFEIIYFIGFRYFENIVKLSSGKNN